jgi:hypothetical protein
MNTPNTASVADLMKQIDHYAETRHLHGAPEYNVVTSAARQAVSAHIEALSAPAAQGVPSEEMIQAGK